MCICPISCSAVSLSVLTVIRPESRVTEAAVASLFLSFCLSLSLFSAVSLCPSDRLWCCPVVFTTDQWLRVTVLSLQQNETNIDNTSDDSMTRLITLHFLCFCSLYGGDFWPLHQHGCYLKHSVNVFQCCACLSGSGSTVWCEQPGDFWEACSSRRPSVILLHNLIIAKGWFAFWCWSFGPNTTEETTERCL